MFSHSVDLDPQSDTPEDLRDAIEVTLKDGAKTNIFLSYLAKKHALDGKQEDTKTLETGVPSMRRGGEATENSPPIVDAGTR